MLTENKTNDTIKLIKECDAGVKMAISSLDEVLDVIENTQLKQIILDSKNKHRELEAEIDVLLSKKREDEKEPSPIAKAMSWTKMNMKIMANNSDKTIADLITDGCDMGIKTLTRFKNEYNNADNEAVNLTDKLISLEKELEEQLKKYL